MAQSGTHRGQSQSQLQGAFQYGITYSGAAQAGSGSGASSSRKPFSFSANNSDLFSAVKPFTITPISTESTPTDGESHSNTYEQGTILAK